MRVILRKIMPHLADTGSELRVLVAILQEVKVFLHEGRVLCLVEHISVGILIHVIRERVVQ